MSHSPHFSENRRQLLHMAMGGFALLLRYLNWWEAAALAGFALAFNLYGLPRIAGPHVFRDGEHTRRYSSGITLYPLAILLLICLLPERPDIVAAAWGILAIGDGAATIVGRSIGGPRIRWNREKSVAGSAAFVVLGGAAGAFLCWWCAPAVIPPPYAWFVIVAPFAAALAAAAAETVPIRLDDNLSVSATAAAVLWWLSLVSEDMAGTAAAHALGLLPLALALNLVVAGIGYRARTVSLTGAIVGALLGITVTVTAGWRGWLLLLATFAAAVAASRMGLRRKTLLGIAEEHGGRRGAGNAIANTGIATAAAVLAVASYAAAPALVAFVAALAAGGSDTIASEIGKAWGRRTFLFPSFRHVAPGTSGAVSLEGTAAGVAGAFALAGLGVGLGLVPHAALLPIVAGATIGSFAESAMGATLEGAGFVNNDVLNFLNTAVAAAAAVLLVKAIG
jgi:uncharacterized protein (TIGR00297 family)